MAKRHLICMRGERRCYHFTHVVMLVGMLYMYTQVALRLAPDRCMDNHLRRDVCRDRQLDDDMWLLALVQQGAMIYMWMPMNDWIPLVSYGFALFFGLEAFVWLTRAYRQPLAENVLVGVAGPAVVSLAPTSVVGDICMTIMAASMGYMFVGMQLMMSMPPQSEQLAQQQLSAPSQVANDSARYESEEQAPAQAPNATENEPANSSSGTSATKLPESYTIRAGDSLYEIAARFYGDAGQWPKILKVNPDLHPRRLRIGHAIKLPKPVPSR